MGTRSIILFNCIINCILYTTKSGQLTSYNDTFFFIRLYYDLKLHIISHQLSFIHVPIIIRINYTNYIRSSRIHYAGFYIDYKYHGMYYA